MLCIRSYLLFLSYSRNPKYSISGNDVINGTFTIHDCFYAFYFEFFRISSVLFMTEPVPSIYSCDTLALNSGECFDLGTKNTSKVTDFYILSVYFRGIISR